MIKTSFGITLLFFSLTLFGQTTTTKLPSFYSQEDGNSVKSSDLIFNEAVTVLYTDQVHGNVHCKQWIRDKWVEFGVFPETSRSSTVKCHSYEDTFYALVNEEEGWTVFSKTKSDTKWKVIGENNFVPSVTFKNPTLNFNEGNLMIYDKNQITGQLVLYSLQKGKMIVVNSKLKHKLDGNFHYTCTDKGESVMAWKIDPSDKKVVVKVGDKKGKRKSYKIMKGMPKGKTWGIQHLSFYQGKIFMAYHSHAYILRLATYKEDRKKWVTIYPPKNPKEYEAKFSNEMSFVTRDNESKKITLFKFTGDNWLNGVELDIKRTAKALSTIKLIENNNILYLMSWSSEVGCQIHEISSDKN